MTLHKAVTALTGRPLVFGDPEQIEASNFIGLVQKCVDTIKEIPEGSDDCDECDGEGTVECECSECGHAHEAECRACNGTGTSGEHESLSTFIPSVKDAAHEVIKNGWPEKLLGSKRAA